MYEELIVATLRHMNVPGEDKYVSKVHRHYLEEKFHAAFHYNSYANANKYFNELNIKNSIGFNIRIKYLLLKYPTFNNIYKLIRQFR